MNKSYSKLRHIQKSNLILERRLLSEQEYNFRVVGYYRDRGDDLNPDEKYLVVLQIKNSDTGEVYVDVQKMGSDLNQVYNAAVEEFDSEKDNNDIRYKGIELQDAPEFDQLVKK